MWCLLLNRHTCELFRQSLAWRLTTHVMLMMLIFATEWWHDDVTIFAVFVWTLFSICKRCCFYYNLLQICVLTSWVFRFSLGSLRIITLSSFPFLNLCKSFGWLWKKLFYWPLNWKKLLLKINVSSVFLLSSSAIHCFRHYIRSLNTADDCWFCRNVS